LFPLTQHCFQFAYFELTRLKSVPVCAAPSASRFSSGHTKQQGPEFLWASLAKGARQSFVFLFFSDMQGQLAAAQAEAMNLHRANEGLPGRLVEAARLRDESATERAALLP
jgi:hypothetical protein